MSSQIQTLLKQKRQQSRGGKLRLRRGKVHLFPSRFETQYEKALLLRARRMIDLTRLNILNPLKSILKEANQVRPDSGTIVLDDFADEVSQLISSTRSTIETEFTDVAAERTVQEIAVGVSAFNKAQTESVMRSIAGVDIFLDEPYLQQELNAFIRSNVSLIKTLDERHFGQIEELVFRGARQGLRHEVIRKQIQSKFKNTRNNARRIARDQINKLNGQLSELRQRNIGVTHYDWITVGDERVRGNPVGRFPNATPSHYDRDGKQFSWKKPPSDGHPGQPIQCRCWARPVLDVFG